MPNRSRSTTSSRHIANRECFNEGKEQWLKGVIKVTWENFFLVCTEELDDISQRAAKMLMLYCLEIVEDVASRIRGQVSAAKITDAMKREFEEQYRESDLPVSMGNAPRSGSRRRDQRGFESLGQIARHFRLVTGKIVYHAALSTLSEHSGSVMSLL